MLIVTYNPGYGFGVADGGVVQIVDEILQKKMTRVVVSNQSVIDELRLRVCKGEISHNEIVFKFKDKYIEVNKYGASPSGYPKGFMSTVIDRTTELLRCACNKRKEERNK